MVSEPIEIRCPSCRSPVAGGSAHFPFCSERCRYVDLGHWLEERYRIPDEPSPDDALPDDPSPEDSPPEDPSPEDSERWLDAGGKGRRGARG